MRLVLLGAPGAGKGTQAVMLAEVFGIPHISTGDIFRSNIKNNTELGKMAREYIDKGELVPDKVTIGIIKDRLVHPDCKEGFILDGFPRTIPQAEYLDDVLTGMGMSLDCVVDIEVSDNKIISRLSGRRVCPSCGMIYHILSYLPAKEGICDRCASGIIQREDDKEETVINRLMTYHDQTEPLIDYYRQKGKLLVVEGKGRIEDTSEALLKTLGVK